MLRSCQILEFNDAAGAEQKSVIVMLVTLFYSEALSFLCSYLWGWAYVMKTPLVKGDGENEILSAVEMTLKMEMQQRCRRVSHAPDNI